MTEIHDSDQYMTQSVTNLPAFQMINSDNLSPIEKTHAIFTSSGYFLLQDWRQEGNLIMVLCYFFSLSQNYGTILFHYYSIFTDEVQLQVDNSHSFLS